MLLTYKCHQITWVSDVLNGGFSSPCTIVPSPAGPRGSPASHRRAVVPSVTIETLVVVHCSRHIAVGSQRARLCYVGPFNCITHKLLYCMLKNMTTMMVTTISLFNCLNLMINLTLTWNTETSTWTEFTGRAICWGRGGGPWVTQVSWITGGPWL